MRSPGPLVSVVIPAYGHAAFIRETLHSVFAQTYRDFEVIVVNDCSPDGTSALLAPLVQSGQILYVEHEKNQGQAAARNRGLALARGKYVAFLDDDDLWPEDRLEVQVAELENQPHVGMLVGRAEIIKGAGQTLCVTPFVEKLDSEQLFCGNPIWSPGQVIIRKAILDEMGGFDPQIWGADDWDLWLSISRQSRILMHDHVALRYRLHPGNASRHAWRLFQACQQVISRNVPTFRPGHRRNLRRLAYRSVYCSLGKGLLNQFKADLREHSWRRAWRKFLTFMHLASLGDRLLARFVIRDLFVAPVRKRGRRLQYSFRGHHPMPPRR